VSLFGLVSTAVVVALVTSVRTGWAAAGLMIASKLRI